MKVPNKRYLCEISNLLPVVLIGIESNNETIIDLVRHNLTQILTQLMPRPKLTLKFRAKAQPFFLLALSLTFSQLKFARQLPNLSLAIEHT